MSGELPHTNSDDVGERLRQLEQRLERAQEAKDRYLEDLKSRNPELFEERAALAQRAEWRPRARPEPQNESADAQPARQLRARPSLMQRLETSAYFWEPERPTEGRLPGAALPTSTAVPSALVLPTDLDALTRRLRQIGADVRNLRQYRLSAPTDVYFNALNVPMDLRRSDPAADPLFYQDPAKADLPSLAEVRFRLLNMQLNVEKRARELMADARAKHDTLSKRRLGGGLELTELERRLLTRELQGLAAEAGEEARPNQTAAPVQSSGGPVQSTSAQAPPTFMQAPPTFMQAPPTSSQAPPNFARPEPAAPTAQPAQPQIVPVRTLTFSAAPSAAAPAVPASQPAAPAAAPETRAPGQPPSSSASYNHILSLLRPAADAQGRAADSASSSSEDEAGGVREPAPAPNFLQQLAQRAQQGQPSTAAQQKKADSDSDSEFFK